MSYINSFKKFVKGEEKAAAKIEEEAVLGAAPTDPELKSQWDAIQKISTDLQNLKQQVTAKELELKTTTDKYNAAATVKQNQQAAQPTQTAAQPQA